MTAQQLIEQLRAAGVKLSLNGDKIRMQAPQLVPGMREKYIELLREHKTEIVALLQTQSEQQYGEPYEVAPGVKLHPPKTDPAFLAWREMIAGYGDKVWKSRK